jgi:prevent-host-death family protein
LVTVGAFEAKTTLSALLERVAGGEEVLITKHERAVARLVPAGAVDQTAAKVAIAALERESQGRKLRGLSVRKSRESGRAGLPSSSKYR